MEKRRGHDGACLWPAAGLLVPITGHGARHLALRSYHAPSRSDAHGDNGERDTLPGKCHGLAGGDASPRQLRKLTVLGQAEHSTVELNPVPEEPRGIGQEAVAALCQVPLCPGVVAVGRRQGPDAAPTAGEGKRDVCRVGAQINEQHGGSALSSVA